MGGNVDAGSMPSEPTLAAPIESTADAGEGKIDLVNFQACGPECANCGGAGCFGGSGGSNIPPGGGILSGPNLKGC